MAVASKVVSTCERRIKRLSEVQVSQAARRLAKRWKMDEHLSAIVMGEANKILGGVDGFLLTEKEGILTANAGVDLKNSPKGTATLWPRNPGESARRLQIKLERQFNIRVGVEIVDSRVTPLRLGTTGLAIGVSGFRPVKDERGKRDLYGRKVHVTRLNIADDLAAAVHLLMGETKERIGAVVVRNAQIRLSSVGSTGLTKLSAKQCLIINGLTQRSN